MTDSTHEILHNSFSSFSAILLDVDNRRFQSTLLEDVWESVRIIEHGREQQRRMRNFKRRIEPFLLRVRTLGSILTELCCSDDQIVYLWAPMKLILETLDEHDEYFTLLVGAYSRLAQSMPTIEELLAFSNCRHGRIQIITDLCTDLLEFHQRTYVLIRRTQWTHMFMAAWNDFSRFFKAILRRLDRSRFVMDLLCRQIVNDGSGSHTYAVTNVADNARVHQGNVYGNVYNTTELSPAMVTTIEQILREGSETRQTLLNSVREEHAKIADRQLQDCIEWLELQGMDRAQKNLFDARAEDREPGTCQWLLQHSSFQSWIEMDHKRKFLWLQGKPGSGKTTLATTVLHEAVFPADSLVLILSCEQAPPDAVGMCCLLFRILLAQIIRKRPSLMPYVYEECVKKAADLNLSNIVQLTKTLFASLPAIYIIVDGLDECTKETQQLLLKKLEFSTSGQHHHSDFDRSVLKILICSRQTGDTPQRLHKEPTISLSRERQSLSHDIKLYARRRILEADLAERFSQQAVDDVTTQIVNKADGMFLWVRLVLGMVLDQFSLADLEATIKELPKGLSGLYQTILDAIDSRSEGKNQKYIRNMLTLLAFGKRAMFTREFCDALVLSEVNVGLSEKTRLGNGILQYCKPLLEERPDGTVAFIHFSVKEFLLNKASGPYLQRTSGYEAMAYVCLRYLATCKTFFRDEQSAIAYRDIILSKHDLFVYVQEHWHQHFSMLVKDSKPGNVSISTPLNHTELSDHQEHFCSAPHISDWLRDWMQKMSKQLGPNQCDEIASIFDTILAAYIHKTGNTEEERELATNSDAITQAYRQYKKMVEAVINGTIPYALDSLSLTEAQLSNFRASHANSAYLCHWKDCPWSVQGFATVQERDAHLSRHQSAHRCPHDCDLSQIPLASRAALRRHINKYHTSLEEIALPALKTSKPRPIEDLRTTTPQYSYTKSAGPDAGVSSQLWYSSDEGNETRKRKRSIDNGSRQSPSRLSRLTSHHSSPLSSPIVRPLSGSESDDSDALRRGRQVEAEDEVTRCICGKADHPLTYTYIETAKHSRFLRNWMANNPLSLAGNRDMGCFFVQCDDCQVWQHGGCVGIPEENLVPESYHCERCMPKLHLVFEARGQSMRSSQYLPVANQAESGAYDAQFRRQMVQQMSQQGSPAAPKSPPSEAETVVDPLEKNSQHDVRKRRQVYEEDQILRQAIADSESEIQIDTVMGHDTAVSSPLSSPSIAAGYNDAASSPFPSDAGMTDAEGDNIATSTIQHTTEILEEDYTIKCICGYDDDDGNTVFCEQCKKWQHIDCYYHNTKVPETHVCVDCGHIISGFHRKAARNRQRKLRHESEKERLSIGRTPKPNQTHKRRRLVRGSRTERTTSPSDDNSQLNGSVAQLSEAEHLQIYQKQLMLLEESNKKLKANKERLKIERLVD